MDIKQSDDLAAIPVVDMVPELLDQGPAVINVGLEDFASELAGQGVEVVHVAWMPPAGGDAELADLLSRLGG